MNKCQYPHSPFQCWKIVKCKLALDQSVLSTLHMGGEGQNAYKMKFPNLCGSGCSFYIMPQKIQPIRTQESRCIFNGSTHNLQLVTVFSRAAWYKMQHVLVVYHGLPHLLLLARDISRYSTRMRSTSCIYYMICICIRYNARSDWLTLEPTGRLRARKHQANTYIIVHLTVVGLMTWAGLFKA